MKRYFLLIALLATLYSCGVQRLVPLSTPPPESAFSSVREEYRPLADSIARHTGYVPREGNDFRVIYEGGDKLKLMLEDIAAADSSVYVELFRINPGAVSDTLFHAMEAKARDSLDVRLLPERFSHMTRSISRYLKMRKSGVSVEEWHPRGHFFSNIWEVNRRNHRKFTLVDANVGYIGGRNIADKYFTEWNDEDVRVTGPVVGDIMDAFSRDWKTAGGKDDAAKVVKTVRDTLPGAFTGKTAQLVLDGPAERFHSIQYSYEWALDHAEKEFYMVTPYLAPPRSTLEAMKRAALRGVDVRLIVPEDSDVFFIPPLIWTYFKELLSSGVKIYLIGGGFLHKKVFLADGYLYCVGSANLDFRSFHTNYESNLIIYDDEAAESRKKEYLRELENCREVSLDEVRKRPFFKRVSGWVIRLFARLI